MKIRTGTFARTLILATLMASSSAVGASPVGDGGDGTANAAAGPAPLAIIGDPESIRSAQSIAAHFFPDNSLDALLGEQFETMISKEFMARLFVLANLREADLPVPPQDTPNTAYLGAARMLDPAFDARIGKLMSTLRQNTIAVMVPMIDELRLAYVAILVRRFNATQLKEIAAFYQTPTGSAFARESIDIPRDPQMLSVMTKFQGRLLDQMSLADPKLTSTMNGGFAPPSGYEDLSPEQQTQMKRMLGIVVPSE